MEETIRMGIMTGNIHVPWKEMYSVFLMVICLVCMYQCAADTSNVKHEEVYVSQTGTVDLPVKAEAGNHEKYLAGNANAVPWSLPGVTSMKAMDDVADVPVSKPMADNITSAVAGESESIAAVPSEITVIFDGNGGTLSMSEYHGLLEEFDIQSIAQPERKGKLFDGWFEDAECTRPFTAVDEETEELRLYAGWKEIPGFMCNDNGYVTKCKDQLLDELLVLPENEACCGITANALDGLENDIFEICIPKNIIYIEPGAFDKLNHLMYIEVLPGNPAYYSENGILYDRSGNIVCNPY